MITRAAPLAVLSCLCWSLAVGAADAPAPTADVVATIGGTPVTRAELDAQMRGLLDQQQRAQTAEFERLQTRFDRTLEAMVQTELDRLLTRRVIDLEAAERNTLNVQVLKDVRPRPVSDADVRAYYDEQLPPLEEPFEAVQKSIRDGLMLEETDIATRRYVQTLRRKFAVEVVRAPARIEVAATGPALGAANAPVTVVEFADLRCYYCGRSAWAMKRLMKEYPGKVRWVFRHLPLVSLHPDAGLAAEVAMCANEQGAFWKVADEFWRDLAPLDAPAARARAVKVGVEPGALDACLESKRVQDGIQRDADDAAKLKVLATPTFFVNGRILTGQLSYFDLTGLVDSELELAQRGGKATKNARQ